MLTVVEKLIFVVFAATCFYYAYTGFKRVVEAVARGDKSYYPRFDHLTKRFGEAVAKTVSQVTVFRDRPVVSFFHSFIFYGFVFYLLVNVLDGLRGFLPQAWWGGVGFGPIGGCSA